jgi:hypothetical protein
MVCETTGIIQPGLKRFGLPRNLCCDGRDGAVYNPESGDSNAFPTVKPPERAAVKES